MVQGNDGFKGYYHMTKYWPISVIALSLLMSAPALADSTATLTRLVQNGSESTVDSPAAAPAKADAVDDGIVRITPDQTKIITLDQDAASVIVANPAYAQIVLDSPRLLVVMPRTPGATSFTVINAKGETIVTKTVIVSAIGTGANKAKYVRIRRMCGNDSSCQPSAYFYCPDGCYEVMPVQPEGGTTPAPEVVGSAPNVTDGNDLQQNANPISTHLTNDPAAGVAPNVTTAPPR